MQLANINAGREERWQSSSRNAALQREELTKSIVKINEEAFRLSQKKELQSAVDKLKEGEQLLEYAAESCQNIRRELIILVLHNIVSLSQVLWDLATASNYLEGLIYNFQITGSSKNNSRITIEDTPTSATILEEDVGVQTQLAEYYLQYCAINSQLRKHKNAQMAARKAIRILVHLLKQSQWGKYNKISEAPESEAKKNILRLLLDRWEAGLNDKEQAANFITVCEGLWKSEMGGNKKSPLQGELKLFSIGNVMTLDYKRINVERKGQLFKQHYYHFILMSMSLFSLGTEARFGKEEKLAEAKHFHSLSILFYLIFVPFESPYIQHIKENYLKNYGHFPLDASPSSVSYKHLWGKMRRDSTLDSTINLQQESVNTVEQQKRKNQRLKQQNLKLKHICLAQHKPKHQPKSYEKAKSLTISHSNPKKVSIDLKRGSNKVKQDANKTNLHCTTLQNEQYYHEKGPDAKRKHENERVHAKDEMAEKYFEMAFKKEKLRSPQPQRKDSIQSTSSTKDRSGNVSKSNLRGSKERVSKIKSKKGLKR